MPRNTRRFVLVLLAAIASGCASTGDARTTPTAHAERPSPPALRDSHALSAFQGHTGLSLSWDSLAAQAANADIVLIGEMHGHPQGLDFAATLFEELAARKPNTAALSMEFFERDDQLALDDYIDGLTDEDAFKAAARRNPGNYPEPHRAMVESAKQRGRPVIASNAPRRYVRLARTDGFDRLRELGELQRQMFDIPQTLTEGRYREKFYGLMSGMGGHGEETDEDPVLGFYRSQNLWDETMARSIAREISNGSAPIVHVVGQFHIDEDGGLVTRLREILPTARILTITTADAWSDTLREEDENRADAIVYVGPR